MVVWASYSKSRTSHNCLLVLSLVVLSLCGNWSSPDGNTLCLLPTVQSSRIDEKLSNLMPSLKKRTLWNLVDHRLGPQNGCYNPWTGKQYGIKTISAPLVLFFFSNWCRGMPFVKLQVSSFKINFASLLWSKQLSQKWSQKGENKGKSGKRWVWVDIEVAGEMLMAGCLSSFSFQRCKGLLRLNESLLLGEAWPSWSRLVLKRL